MYATAAERDETLRIIGETDPKIISTYITEDPGVDPSRVRDQVQRLQQACARKGVLFDYRPKVHPPLIDPYYTPGTPLAGRCLYPFMHARVSFSGKVFFCPFIRVEVGDLTTQTLGEVWNGEKYVELRKTLLEHELFPVCRRCCKVELSAPPTLPATKPAKVLPAIAPVEALAPAEP
jgi:hypothetical protein